MPRARKFPRTDEPQRDIELKLPVRDREPMSDDEVLAEIERAANDLGLLFDDLNRDPVEYEEIITTNRISLEVDSLGDPYVTGPHYW